MALVKCKECGKEVSKRAETCPHCGARRIRKAGCGSYLLLGLVLVVALMAWVVSESPAPRPADRSAQPERLIAPPSEPDPVLELVSFECTKTDGGTYAMIRGQVRNLTDRPIDAVMVMGKFETESGQDLGSDRSYLDIRPLLPGQVSPFEIYGTTNPEYARCGVTAMLIGARQVEWRSAR